MTCLNVEKKKSDKNTSGNSQTSFALGYKPMLRAVFELPRPRYALRKAAAWPRCVADLVRLSECPFTGQSAPIGRRPDAQTNLGWDLSRDQGMR
jgi:hypothetical protein